MKKIVLFGVLWLIAMNLRAQSEEAKITETINRLFEGMYRADSSMVRSVFAKNASLATPLKSKEGKSLLKWETVDDFVKSTGIPQPEPLSEEIWNIKILIDGDFAQAWCEYAFYVGNRFNHCGVDAFHLYKTETGWKIFHLADTRRKEGCIIPSEIQQKHSK